MLLRPTRKWRAECSPTELTPFLIYHPSSRPAIIGIIPKQQQPILSCLTIVLSHRSGDNVQGIHAALRQVRNRLRREALLFGKERPGPQAGAS